MIAWILTLQWWWIVAIVLTIILWLIFGTNIYISNRTSYNKKPWLAALIYAVFCGFLGAASIPFGIISAGYGIHWLNVTDGGEKPYTAPVVSNKRDTLIVKDTVILKEETKSKTWMDN